MAEDRPSDLDIVLYSELTDTVPHPRRIAWDQLAQDLSQHDVRTEKDGPGWSATVYRKQSTRGKTGVEVVTALVFDVDHDEVQWSLLDGLEYVAHTTWKHYASDEHVDCQGRNDCPHWRIVIPLSEPIAVAAWDEFRQRARFWLCPNADESAKDAPRFFWLPTHRPYTIRDSRRQRGHWLSADDLRAIPADEPAKQKTTFGSVIGQVTHGERPGDRYEREASWLTDLLPNWTPVGIHGDNLMMRRPGSTHPYGATISKQGHGVLYVFTDGAPPLEPNTCYSKFWALATLEYGGDPKAAARALAERYDMPRRNGTVVGQIGNLRTVGSGDSEPEARPLTETGNAERLVDQYGKDMRFCHPWGVWLAWDGRRWKRDEIGQVRRWGKAVVRSIYDEISRAETADERAAIFKWGKASEKAAARAALVKLAESEAGVHILPEEMDADPWLLNVLNGTIDLRTGELRPHDRADNMTKLAPVYFDPDAECPIWLTFLARVLPDIEVRKFLRYMTGYGLTGMTVEQCLAFFYGGGANGKSTFLDTMQDMLGDYAKTAAPDLLTSRGGDRHPTELADLFGARWVSSIEVDEGKHLAETLVKQMTGGDKLKARFMRTDFFQWAPTHKLFLAANHKPEIRGTDYAIWRRIRLIPFTVTIPESERDMGLGTKLRAELPGILNWAVAGCLDWQKHGLLAPQAVRDATEEYRQEQDVLAGFLDEHCLMDAQGWVNCGALIKVYGAWCEANNNKPISTTAFGRRMTERGLTSTRGRDGKKMYAGVRLRGSDEGVI